MGILYQEDSVWVFVIFTVIMGGGAAWLTGRAIALTWRPAWQILVYSLLLGATVRFLRFALFDGTLLSLHYFLVDTAVVLIAAALGFRWTRSWQMATQYPWLYRRTSPFTWAPRDVAEGNSRG